MLVLFRKCFVNNFLRLTHKSVNGTFPYFVFWNTIQYPLKFTDNIRSLLVNDRNFYNFVYIYRPTTYRIFRLYNLSDTRYTWHAFNKTPTEERSDTDAKRVKNWKIYACVATGTTAIILLILLVMRKRIGLVVQLFREASKAAAKMPGILLQPLWTLIVLASGLAAIMFIFMYVQTAGDPVVDTSTGLVEFKQVRVSVKGWSDACSSFKFINLFIPRNVTCLTYATHAAGLNGPVNFSVFIWKTHAKTHSVSDKNTTSCSQWEDREYHNVRFEYLDMLAIIGPISHRFVGHLLVTCRHTPVSKGFT